MADERLRLIVKKFGGLYGGSGITSTIERRVTPDKTVAPPVARGGVFDKLTAVLGQTAKIGATVAGAGARFAVNTAVDVTKSAAGVAKTLVNLSTQPGQLSMANKAMRELSSGEKKLNDVYRSGKISSDDYKKSLERYSSARKELDDKFLRPIYQGDSAKEQAGDVVETVANILTLGRFTPIKGVAKTVAQTGLDKSLLTGAKKIEEILLRIPSAKELIARNTASIAKREAQMAAGETMEQYIAREGKRVAVGLLVKRPLFYQQNVEDVKDVYSGMVNGDYGSALKSTGWIASQMLAGGPVGWFINKGKQAGVKLRELSVGRGSLIDTVSSQIGDKNPAQMARYMNRIKERAPKEYKKSEEILRILQETNLRVADENVGIAAKNVIHTYDQAGVDRATITPKMIIDDYSKWHEAAQIADSLKGKNIRGLDQNQIDNLVVVRWDSVMKRGLANAIEEAGDDIQAMTNVINDLSNRPSNGWGNNPNLMKQLIKIVSEAPTAKDAAARIKSIPTATVMPDNLPKSVQKKLSELGYGVAVPLSGVRKTPMVKLEEARKIITGAVRGNTEVFDEAIEPMPALAAINGALSKAGLSPQGTNKVANDSLRQSLVASIAKTDIGRSLGMLREGDAEKGGAALLSQLQRYVEKMKPVFALGKISSGKNAVTDIRMLRPSEIAEALGVSQSSAKEVQKAILDAYTKVPLELRGLGDRAVDYAFKYNPAHKYYARIQSALRYTYNPFFRTQEMVETSILSKMNANKFLWTNTKKELDETAEKLANYGLFEGNLSSAAADDVVFGRISANLTKSQKRNLSGLALSVADRKGISIDEMMEKYPDELEDAIKIVVQYPNKGVMTSALARTLNVAFFPMRYNAKVSMMAAKKIAELPPSLQLGVIQGFMKMKDWLKSDEGIKWQSENSDALQVLRWITPMGSIEQFYKIVSGNAKSPGDFGLLGGLPFGLISQILDSQGVIKLNTPYINPKTGDQLPNYIPQTARARAAVAVNDLIGTMFSFPGRTLGLPGKEATLRKTIDAFIDTNGKDFDKQYDMERLTPLQKNWIRVLKGDTSEEAIDSLYTSPAPGQFNYYTLPPFDMPAPVQRVPEKVNVLSKTEVARQKAAIKASKPKKVASPITRPQ